MPKLEFVGGPIDGEVRRVDAPHDYLIPIPVEHPLIEMHHGLEMEPVEMTMYVHVYKPGKKLVQLPGDPPRAIDVMVYDGQVKR